MSIKILRISNSSGPTSSPFNFFTLARSRYYPNEETTFLAFDKNECAGLDTGVTGDIILEQANKNPFKFKKIVHQWAKHIKQSKAEAVIHIHQPGAGVIFAVFCKGFCRRIPVVYTVHNNYANYKLRHKLFMALCFLVSDRVTFVSKDAWHSFADKRIKPAKSKCIVIQNGVDVERVDNAVDPTSASRAADGNTLRIMTIGRAVPQKNQGFLLELLERWDGSCQLDVYGKGPLIDNLRKEATRKGLDGQINIKGLVPREEVFMAIARSDVFVSPSLWEGLPIALMEAMCVGVPCIVSDIPSHREAGEKSEGVFLTELKVQAWYNALRYLDSMSREQRFVLGKKNRKVIERHFSVRRMQENYKKVYEELVKEEQ